MFFIKKHTTITESELNLMIKKIRIEFSGHFITKHIMGRNVETNKHRSHVQLKVSYVIHWYIFHIYWISKTLVWHIVFDIKKNRSDRLTECFFKNVRHINTMHHEANSITSVQTTTKTKKNTIFYILYGEFDIYIYSVPSQ